jgi:cobalt/nickel transport protein
MTASRKKGYRMARTLRIAALLATATLWATPVLAHFGMVIPSSDVVADKDKAKVTLTVSFSHPMEGKGMDMAKPRAFGVKDGDRTTDLLETLKPAKVMDHAAWTAEYVFKRPGLGVFFMSPEPYFEPAEDKYIEHITKVVVPAFGEEEGWDLPIGLPAEIVPLTRPFGNYVANVFTGRVLMDGKPAAGVTVEVEYYNKDKAYEAPNETMTSQAVKTDPNGIFTYAVPFAGWWGFAALVDAPETMQKDGVDKKIERGAVLWAKFVDPKRKKK